jgi:hypothetical protein
MSSELQVEVRPVPADPSTEAQQAPAQLTQIDSESIASQLTSESETHCEPLEQCAKPSPQPKTKTCPQVNSDPNTDPSTLTTDPIQSVAQLPHDEPQSADLNNLNPTSPLSNPEQTNSLQENADETNSSQENVDDTKATEEDHKSALDVPSFSLTDFFQLMRSEQQRLQTFLLNDFESKFVTPESLAKAGFFFMLQGDRVMCAFCKMTFWGWHEGSHPVRDHFELNPRCRFLNGCDVGNEPIDKGPVELVQEEFGELDTCGNGSADVEPASSNAIKVDTPPMDCKLVTFDSVDEIDDDELSVTVTEKLDPIIPTLPKSHEMDTCSESDCASNTSDCVPADRKQLLAMMAAEKDRLRTFEIGNWPAFFISPVELARVGFFYTQSRDRVECAFCETFIYDWEPGDRPLLEHIRHSPECCLLKGEATQNTPIDREAFDRVLSIVQTIAPDIPFDHSPSNTDYDVNSDFYMHESYSQLPEVTSTSRPMVDLRFVTFEARKASFNCWSEDSVLDRDAAAAAGFYSVGPYSFCLPVLLCYFCRFY